MRCFAFSLSWASQSMSLLFSGHVAAITLVVVQNHFLFPILKESLLLPNPIGSFPVSVKLKTQVSFPHGLVLFLALKMESNRVMCSLLL